jgi:hypothetical protein
MNSQKIIEDCERIISTVIRDFLVNGTEDDETTDLVFDTIQTLDGLVEAVRET